VKRDIFKREKQAVEGYNKYRIIYILIMGSSALFNYIKMISDLNI